MAGVVLILCCVVNIMIINNPRSTVSIHKTPFKLFCCCNLRVERRGYKNVFDALGRISREEGVKALWRGFEPTVSIASSSKQSQYLPQPPLICYGIRFVLCVRA